MPEALPLRDYQRASIDALMDRWEGENNRLAVILPTGAGKTVVFAHLIHAVLEKSGGKVLVIAHREELLAQAASKIRAVAPHLRVGIVKAEKDDHQDVNVVIASVQTLAVARRRAAITGISLVIVDEAHHAAAPTYVDVLDHFGAWHGLPVAGFTATMARTDGGLAEVWQEVVYQRDILEMIRDRHLVDVKGKTVVVEGLALDDVKSRGGDFQDGQLGQALDDSGAATVVAEAYLDHAADRPGVVFTPTVATAHTMAEAMNAAGIPTGVVSGAMPKAERASVLEQYAAGDLQVLANCMVLTEGFDAPWASCAVIARPTRSASLYVQMVGRVLRPFKDKPNALVLDVVGVSTRHKLATICDLTGYNVAEPEDEETLTEAAIRSKAAPSIVGGKVKWQDVDLFLGSDTAWLRTSGGNWFIPVADAYYFLTPGLEQETYRVRRWTKEAGAQVPNTDPDYPLEYAMRWAENYAARHGGSIHRRDAAWRDRPATAKQVQTCDRFRIRLNPNATQGEASDLMAAVFASRAIDASVCQSRMAA